MFVPMIHQDDTDFSSSKKESRAALGLTGSETRSHTFLAGYWLLGTGYLLSESSLASFILADSSFFCTRATSV